MLKRTSGLLAAVVMAGAFAVAGAGVANADPGTCGVRESDPTPAGSTTPGGPDGWWVYTARNRCGHSLNLTAVVGGRANFCWSVPPGGSHSYISIAYDVNWRVATC
jgi:hypothetical protein